MNIEQNNSQFCTTWNMLMNCRSLLHHRQVLLTVCVFNHSHKPIYDSKALVIQTIKKWEHFIHINSDVYILTGDLNQMDIGTYEVDLGFVQLVMVPTHKTNILDKYLTHRQTYLMYKLYSPSSRPSISWY